MGHRSRPDHVQVHVAQTIEQVLTVLDHGALVSMRADVSERHAAYTPETGTKSAHKTPGKDVRIRNQITPRGLRTLTVVGRC